MVDKKVLRFIFYTKILWMISGLSGFETQNDQEQSYRDDKQPKPPIGLFEGHATRTESIWTLNFDL